MREVQEYLIANGITLTATQLEQVLSIYKEYGITDFGSVEHRVEKIFIEQKGQKRDHTRNRTYVVCKICKKEQTADKKKFRNHIRVHFDRMSHNVSTVSVMSCH